MATLKDNEWADARETSYEIARAIWEKADDEEEAQRLWADPTTSEARSIVARAWELDCDNQESLFWGCEEIYRVGGGNRE